MTQTNGKANFTDSKTTMSLASTPPAPATSPAMANQDTGKVLRKPNDFQMRKVKAEKEDERNSVQEPTTCRNSNSRMLA